MNLKKILIHKSLSTYIKYLFFSLGQDQYKLSSPIDNEVLDNQPKTIKMKQSLLTIILLISCLGFSKQVTTKTITIHPDLSFQNYAF